jgi:BirA family biotin operon repressor/biotin-[acetyl-CoA-carboxylase] ligase
MEIQFEHIHFDSISSTQSEIINHIGKNRVLVSANKQTAGLGRNQKCWQHHPQGLAFSFIAKANSSTTITPLEIGVSLIDFFNEHFRKNLKIKWPNDLMSEDNYKIGGILIKLQNSKIIVGIGLNIDSIICPLFKGKDFEAKILTLENLSKNYQKDLPAQFYQYFLKNRLNETQVRRKFQKSCAHLQNKVSIIDGKKISKGVFTGLGEYGEALLETKNGLEKIFTGSLILD